MEADAVDKLIEKGRFQSDIALAIGEAIDVTIKAANLVTVSMLDARFAVQDAKMEARFASVEKSIASAKVWAVYLYATLAIAFFGTLAADHHWIVSREDQLMAHWDQEFKAAQTRSDQNFKDIRADIKAFEARTDQKFNDFEARTDKKFNDFEARSDQKFNDFEARSDQKFKEFEARSDQKFKEFEARSDQKFKDFEARSDKKSAAMQALWEQGLQQRDGRLDQHSNGSKRD